MLKCDLSAFVMSTLLRQRERERAWEGEWDWDVSVRKWERVRKWGRIKVKSEWIFSVGVCISFFSHTRFLLFCKSGIKKEKNSLNFFLELTFWVFNSKAWRLNFENLEGQQDVKKVQSCFSCKKSFKTTTLQKHFPSSVPKFLLHFHELWKIVIGWEKEEKENQDLLMKKNCCPWYENFLNLFRRNWTILNFFHQSPNPFSGAFWF